MEGIGALMSIPVRCPDRLPRFRRHMDCVTMRGDEVNGMNLQCMNEAHLFIGKAQKTKVELTNYFKIAKSTNREGRYFSAKFVLSRVLGGLLFRPVSLFSW